MDMSAIDIFLTIGTAFFLGYIVGQTAMALKVRNTLKQLAKDNGINYEEMEERFLKDNKPVTIKVPTLFTESNKNSILLYSKDTGKFISQAETFDELASNVYTFNNINFAMVKHGEELFWFVEGKVKHDLNDLE